MTLTLSAKKVVVEEVSDIASKAISAVLADYRGIPVNDMTTLRAKAREAGVYLRVVPNTLTKRAFNDTPFSCLNDALVGPLFIALSMEAPGDAARLLKEFAKDCSKLEVKALSMDGVAYGPEQLEAIASLPNREEALSKLLAVMKAPIEKFVRTMAAPHTKLVRTLAAVKDQKESNA